MRSVYTVGSSLEHFLFGFSFFSVFPVSALMHVGLISPQFRAQICAQAAARIREINIG